MSTCAGSYALWMIIRCGLNSASSDSDSAMASGSWSLEMATVMNASCWYLLNETPVGKSGDVGRNASLW